MSDDQFDFEKTRTDPLDPNKSHNDPTNREFVRRTIERTMIRQGMDPVQARRESMMAINALARVDKEVFEGKVKEEAKGIEERLLREGVAPGEARRRARTEAADRIRRDEALDTPAARASRPIRPPRSPRPQADPDPMVLVMGCVIAGMLVPAVAFVFYVLLALLFGG